MTDILSRIPWRRRIAVVLASALFFISPATPAQEPEGEEIPLHRMIEDLNRRIAVLEEEKAAAETGAPALLHILWDEGLRFESADRTFALEVGGKIQSDWILQSGSRDLDTYLETQGNDLHDGVEFRRARLTLAGRVRERFIFKAAYDFSGGDAEFKDLYVGLEQMPLNSMLKVGYFREPVSLESNTGEASLRLLERSLMQVLSPSRNTGVGLFGTALDDRLSWGTGVFWNTDAYGRGGEDGGLSASARITGLPWVGGEDRLLHLGMSLSRRGEDDIVFTANPELNQAPDFIDTDGFAAGLSPHAVLMDAADLIGCETALALGPFSLQAEYLRMNIDAPGSADPSAWGGYIEGGFFLTGEQRAYNHEKGAFGEVTPRQDFLAESGGPGAWEITARLSRIDLDDPDIANGGEMADYTAGLTWFINPSVRLSANYVHSHLEHVGSARLFLLRVALKF